MNSALGVAKELLKHKHRRYSHEICRVIAEAVECGDFMLHTTALTPAEWNEEKSELTINGGYLCTYIPYREDTKRRLRISGLESQLAEARDLVRGLVECVKSYGATDMWAVSYETNIRGKDVFYKTEALSDESDIGGGVVLAGKRARQCLKDNKEAIERLTKEDTL